MHEYLLADELIICLFFFNDSPRSHLWVVVNIRVHGNSPAVTAFAAAVVLYELLPYEHCRKDKDDDSLNDSKSAEVRLSLFRHLFLLIHGRYFGSCGLFRKLIPEELGKVRIIGNEPELLCA